jgi:hypothetical protein
VVDPRRDALDSVRLLTALERGAGRLLASPSIRNLSRLGRPCRRSSRTPRGARRLGPPCAAPRAHRPHRPPNFWQQPQTATARLRPSPHILETDVKPGGLLGGGAKGLAGTASGVCSPA